MNILWTWKKIVLFAGIIGLGIIGLIIADQQDYLSGRTNSQTAIGNGTADPLAESAELIPAKKIESVPVKKTVIPDYRKNSGIDGVREVIK